MTRNASWLYSRSARFEYYVFIDYSTTFYQLNMSYGVEWRAVGRAWTEVVVACFRILSHFPGYYTEVLLKGLSLETLPEPVFEHVTSKVRSRSQSLYVCWQSRIRFFQFLHCVSKQVTAFLDTPGNVAVTVGTRTNERLGVGQTSQNDTHPYRRFLTLHTRAGRETTWLLS